MADETTTSPLICTKLHRPHLLKLLDQRRQCPLTLVALPAGYGQTTLVAGLALALGLLHGFFNSTAMAQAGGGMLALLGIAAAVFVAVALVAAFVVSLRAAWTRVAVRVAGSWIAAIGILMLGWTFRG